MTTDIINEVAGELGISATNIISELTKLKILQNAFWCCVCAFIALICLFVFIKEIKKKDPYEVTTIFSLFLFVFLFFCVLGFSYELAKWLTSPQISALQYFVNKMR